jgi:non-homologous end joining protein Ku
MLEAELEGRPAEEAGKPGLAPVADLMAALNRSPEEASEAPRKGPLAARKAAPRAPACASEQDADERRYTQM